MLGNDALAAPGQHRFGKITAQARRHWEHIRMLPLNFLNLVPERLAESKLGLFAETLVRAADGLSTGGQG